MRRNLRAFQKINVMNVIILPRGGEGLLNLNVSFIQTHNLLLKNYIHF